ncbi:MAG TPA: 4Fe-4S dicluster domain-containing protein [Anaerolineae bacterium]|nr:4Fe-4S dicluster domain-containing protein [Anaerolineae bacterium]HQI83800.1 4Fe-4S dicluster domain-containing protein [Anaerolineae bacterium]
MTSEMHPFLTEVMSLRGGKDVLECYQCGTCSASCPALPDMVHGPRRIMYMIQNGMEKDVLSSPDIWRCVSCYSCMNRCPRGIEITVLFSELRRLAIQKGYVEDAEAQFGQAFTVTLAQHGRMFEPELLMRYYLRTWDVRGMLEMIGPGLKMLLKRKVTFTPKNIAASQELRDAGVVPPVGTYYRSKLRNRVVSIMIAVLGFFAAIGRLFSGGKKETLHG